MSKCNEWLYCDICKCMVLDVDIWTHAKRHADGLIPRGNSG